METTVSRHTVESIGSGNLFDCQSDPMRVDAHGHTVTVPTSRYYTESIGSGHLYDRQSNPMRIEARDYKTSLVIIVPTDDVGDWDEPELRDRIAALTPPSSVLREWATRPENRPPPSWYEDETDPFEAQE